MGNSFLDLNFITADVIGDIISETYQESFVVIILNTKVYGKRTCNEVYNTV